jgi:hypothetical protein
MHDHGHNVNGCDVIFTRYDSLVIRASISFCNFAFEAFLLFLVRASILRSLDLVSVFCTWLAFQMDLWIGSGHGLGTRKTILTT